MAPPEVTGKKTGRRLLDYKALRERGIPWTRIHIGRLEEAGEFPLHINVGKSSIAWFEDEVDDFLEAKAVERDTKAAERKAKLLVRSESDPQSQTAPAPVITKKGRFRRQPEKLDGPDG
jgi:prophage regulatory protein